MFQQNLVLNFEGQALRFHILRLSGEVQWMSNREVIHLLVKAGYLTFKGKGFYVTYYVTKKLRSEATIVP